MSQIARPRFTSLRSILISWFVVFSIVPLALVSAYSLIKFKKAIESEQLQRLSANGREIEVIISDFLNQMKNQRDQLSKSPQLTYNLSIGDVAALKEISSDQLGNSMVTSLSFYNRDGIRLLQSVKEDKGQISHLTSAGEKVALNGRYIAQLKEKTDLGLVNQELSNGVELILLSRIHNSSGRLIGYVEQKVSLTLSFLVRVKNRLKLDLMLLNNNQKILSSTLYFPGQNFNEIIERKNSYFDSDILMNVRNRSELYGFIIYPIAWDQSSVQLAIGTSKKESELVLSNVNVAFVGVISLVVLFLIVTILISTSLLLKPINELIDGLRAFERTEKPVFINVKNKTEIGILTATFNQMSLKIFQARQDLKKKINELEQANSSLKEAQTKLVHSAKMTSLGQLVAGVAHELNNPIGFIYSNMSHLKESAEKLFLIIEEIEKNPDQAAQIKEKHDFDYIQKDLPRLIKSCQDGSQRTRDIVIGLRNFSRLEESQLKEIDIHESIETTLELLKGEISSRLKINRQYETIPKVSCYASQINQVFMNILSNAVHAVQGNGQIWISTNLIKATQNQTGKVQVSIQDSGSGMKPDVLDKIFEPFFTTKEVGRGTGLGLSISYGIIQNHGGDIQVRSQLGVGTEFIITIPITQQSKKS